MPTRYSTGAIILHWAIAIAVIVTWRIAESAEHVTEAQEKAIMGNHMALGMIILALTIVRLLWRFTHDQPAFPGDLARWETVLARIVHFTFYVLLLGLPLMGWIGNSMEDGPIDVFGLFTIPALPLSSDRGLGHEILEVHGTLGSVMIYLISLHVLGALKHQFVDKNGEFYRMLPFGRPKSRSAP
jgi:cytochrome b561